MRKFGEFVIQFLQRTWVDTLDCSGRERERESGKREGKEKGKEKGGKKGKKKSEKR